MHGHKFHISDRTFQILGWKWYKIDMKNGLFGKIPESHVEKGYCQTDSPGFIIDKHPVNVGEVKNATICFVDVSFCDSATDVQIKNCGEYFLYFLPTVPKCDLRYCAE